MCDLDVRRRSKLFTVSSSAKTIKVSLPAELGLGSSGGMLAAICWPLSLAFILKPHQDGGRITMTVEIYAFWKEGGRFSGVMGGSVEEIVNGIVNVNGDTHLRHTGMVFAPLDIGKQVSRKIREMDQAHETELEAIEVKYSNKRDDLFQRNLLNPPAPEVTPKTSDNVTALPLA